ncbi:MAG: hypothetical protein ACXWKB_00635 [Methyloceanibacter sp.]
MQPLTGCAFVKAMRHAGGAPLCFVPAVIMSAHARPSHVEDALRAGAHQVLVLPTSASTLYRRLDWLLNDDRPYELSGEHYVIAGMEQRLSLSYQRPTLYADSSRRPVRASRPHARRSQLRQNFKRHPAPAAPWTRPMR